MGSNKAYTQISLLGCGVEARATLNRVKKKVSEVILTTREINAIQIFYLLVSQWKMGASESYNGEEKSLRHVAMAASYTKKLQSKIHRSFQCNLIPGTSYRSDELIHFANNQFMNEILTWFAYNSSFRNLRIKLSDLRFRNTF